MSVLHSFTSIKFAFKLVLLLSILGMLFNCSSNQKVEPDAQQPDSDMPKIDFHAHYRAERDYLIPLLDSLNLQPVLVDVGKVDTENWNKARSGLIENFQKHPDHYFFCTAFTANGIDEPDYAEKIIQHIEHDLTLGAKMVKVWKNFGMVSTDNSGAYVQIDDQRIQPVWDFLTERNIPVMAHIGEPVQAWRPLKEENPHYGYYKDHPEYHAFQHPEIPSWETIQEARNNWLARNPELTIVGAHQGSMSHDVALIGRILDQYDNFYVEPAARFGDLVLQNSDSVRAYFIKYQDRILYGTDFGTNGNEQEMSADDKTNEKQRLVQRMNAHWRYLSTLDSMELPRARPIATRGLGLPDSVLRKVYYHNAIRILNGNTK
jgi:predicted TIM-barrel fold metal-dependent hydrolase